MEAREGVHGGEANPAVVLAPAVFRLVPSLAPGSAGPIPECPRSRLRFSYYRVHFLTRNVPLSLRVMENPGVKVFWLNRGSNVVS